jgi:HD-GYP domain-containing protein (c-di-GMP phosphodiesterase class II)
VSTLARGPESGGKRHFGGKILWSLLAVCAFLGLAPLASVAWKLIDINREALKTAQQEYQLLLASAVAGEVDTHVESLRSQLVRVSRTLGSSMGRTGGTMTESELRRVLEDIADDRMLYLRYQDLRGRHVDSLASATVPPDLEPLFMTGLRLAAEALAGTGRQGSGAAVMSNPILLAGTPPRAAVILSAPVVSRGAFRGVLSALVDLEAVWDEVTEDNKTGHTLFALDRQGRLFASSEPTRLHPNRDMSSSPLVRRFLSAEGRTTETMPFVWEGRRGSTDRYLGSYETTREGWGIFVQAPEQQVYLPVRAMVESTASWAAAALLMAILAAMVFARTLSKPIQRLADTSRAFASGNFSARVEVRSRNEIGELADTFNRMASEIEDYIRRLRRAAEENNELFLGTIRALAQAIDAKDPYTRGHSVRVNKYSVIVARYLGLKQSEIRDIHVASLLHDVGKIGVDDAILKKPAPLTNEEFGLMKEHPVLGAAIMAPIRQMKNIIPGLRNHHERWAGGGYPDGLTGDAIPLMARIITVADTFDAMTTNRPYQRAMTFPVALERLNELKGAVLDERVVEAFNRAYHAGEFRDEEAVLQAASTAQAVASA